MTNWQEACFVIYQVWTKPATVKSDFARERAETISWAIGRRYLSTEVAPFTMEYGNTLKVTQKGLLYLEEVLAGMAREDILGLLNGSLEEEDGEQPWTVRVD